MNIRQAALFALLLLVVIGSGWFLDKQSVNRLPASVSETGPDSFVFERRSRRNTISSNVDLVEKSSLVEKVKYLKIHKFNH